MSVGTKAARCLSLCPGFASSLYLQSLRPIVTGSLTSGQQLSVLHLEGDASTADMAV